MREPTSVDANGTSLAKSRPAWWRWLPGLVKIVLAAAILIGVGRHIHGLWGKLEEINVTFRPTWVVLSTSFYAAGLILFGLFWRWVILDMSGRTSRFAAVRAYCVGHLGKYVPGKAWVIVIRSGLLRGHGVSPMPAALSALYETATMMAAGAALATLILVVLDPRDWRMLATGAVLSLALGTVVQPLIFHRLARFVTLPFKRSESAPVEPCRYRTLAFGLAILLPGWFLWGASLACAIRSISPEGAPLSTWPLLTAAMALATVAGFVIVIMPGGIGVREWVLMVCLAPMIGEGMAAIAAVLIRLIWVATELGAAAMLYWIGPTRRSK